MNNVLFFLSTVGLTVTYEGKTSTNLCKVIQRRSTNAWHQLGIDNCGWIMTPELHIVHELLSDVSNPDAVTVG
jgi:hypothetical protein